MCNRCGTGDGFELVKRTFKVDFKSAMSMVQMAIIGAPASPLPQEPKSAADYARRLWAQGKRITSHDPVGRYLKKRKLWFNSPALRYIHIKDHDLMLAAISDPKGNLVNIQRTYLTKEGEKAPVEKVRRMLVGRIPQGSAVRLEAHQSVLGVAEGVETAMAASWRFCIPTWAALGTNGLKNFSPPDGVKTVHIFSDNDQHYVGQLAAFTLAARLAKDKFEVIVHIPSEPGDWNDEIRRVAL